MQDLTSVKIPWNYVRIGLYALAGLVALYLLINTTTCKPGLVVDQKLLDRIDSLEKANAALVVEQTALVRRDSVLTAQVLAVDDKIDHVQEKTTIIREYYHEQSQAATNYTNTQVDSFLKARYEY